MYTNAKTFSERIHVFCVCQRKICVMCHVMVAPPFPLFVVFFSDPHVSTSSVCVLSVWAWLTLSCRKRQVKLIPNQPLQPMDLQPIIARSYYQPERYGALILATCVQYCSLV